MSLSAFGDALADLSPSSPSQRFISEDDVINARARVLGGGSCLNAGFYTRASTNYVRKAGWDGRLVNESYEWVEKVVAFKPSMGVWQTAVQHGLLKVGVLPNNGYTFYHVVGTKIGGTIFDGQGQGHTAADLLEYANPSSLAVLLHATVNKILFRTKENGRPTAYGVILEDENGVTHKAYLNVRGKGEIIVSAGALAKLRSLLLES